jgi:hypothetical protein
VRGLKLSVEVIMNASHALVAEPTPLDLYRAAWAKTGNNYFFPERLGDWYRWQHRFDDTIHSVDDAVNAVSEMLSSIGDNYTFLKVPVRQQHAGGGYIPSCRARMLTRLIGYLHIRTFDDPQLTNRLRRQMQSIRHAAGFIVDLRGNGGGLTAQANDACSAFMDSGLTQLLEQRCEGRGGSLKSEIRLTVDRFEQQRYFADGSHESTSWARLPNLTGNQPLVVLVDGDTASAAEQFAAVMRDNGRALIVGPEPTFGKGIAQDFFDLPFGCQLKITDAILLASSGQWRSDCGMTVRNGLVPDRIVSRLPGRDTALDAAMHYMADRLGGRVFEPNPSTGIGAGLLLAGASVVAAAVLARRRAA